MWSNPSTQRTSSRKLRCLRPPLMSYVRPQRNGDTGTVHFFQQPRELSPEMRAVDRVGEFNEKAAPLMRFRPFHALAQSSLPAHGCRGRSSLGCRLQPRTGRARATWRAHLRAIEDSEQHVHFVYLETFSFEATLVIGTATRETWTVMPQEQQVHMASSKCDERPFDRSSLLVVGHPRSRCSSKHRRSIPTARIETPASLSSIPIRWKENLRAEKSSDLSGSIREGDA